MDKVLALVATARRSVTDAEAAAEEEVVVAEARTSARQMVKEEASEHPCLLLAVLDLVMLILTNLKAPR
jgi:hypothetical protein